MEKNEQSMYACMPMKEDMPEGRWRSWELTECPECGKECWITPLVEIELQEGIPALCRECVERMELET